MNRARAVAIGLAFAGSLATAQTPASPKRTPLVAVTHHTGQFAGETVAYTANVSEYFLKDTTGKLLGSMVLTTYTRDDVADRVARPVMFLFNGGPGASSSPLHLSAFGPVRRAAADSMVNNPDSPLDAVDLVFIDPVGTGFSRPFPGVDARRAFWSRTSDAATVRSVIEAWIKENGRAQSPKYLCGESYGTTRAALILEHSGSLRFDGVLLFAVVGGLSGREMPFVATLPTFATTAWFFERIPRNGRTVQQVFDEAVDFARTEYVTALIRGGGLRADERHRVAQRMSALIGLSPERIEANDLRVSKDTFMLTLLANRGVRTGQLDSRATVALDAPKRRPPYDDPGMNYDPEAPVGVGGPALPQTSIAGSPIDVYFKRQLEFKTAETYQALNLDVNAAWNHEGMTDVNASLGDAMRRNPTMRLLWAGGLFDITTPLYAARYALDQAGIPSDRATGLMFSAGHSVFMEKANREVLSAAVRRFVTPAARLGQ